MDDEELRLCGEAGKDARAFVRKYIALKRDAERYRFARDVDGGIEMLTAAIFNAGGPAEIDAWVDAAMKEAK